MQVNGMKLYGLSTYNMTAWGCNAALSSLQGNHTHTHTYRMLVSIGMFVVYVTMSTTVVPYHVVPDSTGTTTRSAKSSWLNTILDL
jgi:hypothetical protein